MPFPKKMKPAEQFDKPLDEWLEEDEEVDQVVNHFDPATQKVTTSIEKAKHRFKVKYEKTSVDSIMCKEFEHYWYVMDRHNYLIRCKHCVLSKRIMPGLEYIDQNGHVRDKATDKLIA